MDSLAAHCQSYVHAVIDEEGDFVGFALFMELFRC
jgi:hypothetical protein